MQGICIHSSIRVRFKNRYLLVEVIWKDGRADDSLTEPILQSVLRESLAVNFGDYGLGLALQSLQVKYFNSLTNVLIVRCDREHWKEVCEQPLTHTPDCRYL